MSAVRNLLRNWRRGEPLRVLSASGQLGYGIPADSLARGLERRPHLIGCDMGSIDPGPYYLGSGRMGAPRQTARRDLALVLKAARSLDVPLLIGSAGTAGAAPHLAATMELLREIAQEERLSFKVATIASDLDPAFVAAALEEGRLAPIGPMPEPTAAAVRGCSHIVGQCGVETFWRALDTQPDVVIAGRACDTAIFAALPMKLGFDAGLALHMAKIIECTSLCCSPAGRDAMLATLDTDGFVLESMNPACHATPASVAAHALYEQADPFRVEEPEGILDLHAARYEALDAHRTRVHGARFTRRERPTLKVEGAAWLGHRMVLLAGTVDPVLIGGLDAVLAAVEQKVRMLVEGDWSLHPHAYGLGAIRALPAASAPPAEVGLVIEFIGTDAEQVRAAAGVFKQNLLHHGFPGRLSTAGNVAFAFTPSELAAEPAYGFVLYHVLQDAPVESLFPISMEQVTAEDLR
ncbi:DUF1446 domain-containing protein [Verticiella sediminum]|uniref:DUF1446 domain-containing protein n=1 Tax=Verticiella sediminum TaxID=1247510 RepID=A0A556AE79_9BURK|nr:acyclic terpene utilization AtuA family protein [Verticiella sediminum]TSH91189.1 DUF1446 domain-containing protein [Verticiella sediminum]